MLLQSHAQYGEDTRVAEFFGQGFKGIFVDVGANDPKALSQTYLLEQLGWHGVLIEPLAHLAKALREQRPASLVVEAAVAAPGQEGTAYMDVPDGQFPLAKLVFEDNAQKSLPRVAVRTLDSILDEARITSVDFMSIDIEGHEVAALQGLSFERFRPALLIVEDRVHNLTCHRLLKGKGYRLVDRMGSNGWYLRRDLAWTLRSHSSVFSRLRKYYLALPFRKLRHSLWRRGHRH